MLLIDTSAWFRIGHAGLASARREEIAEGLEDGQVVAHLPLLLEAGYSARGAPQHSELLSELRALPWAAVDGEVERLAAETQSRLAAGGHHRMPPVDVLVGALAQRHEMGVLHYDRHYDVLLSHGGLTFDSVWLAAPGTLD